MYCQDVHDWFAIIFHSFLILTAVDACAEIPCEFGGENAQIISLTSSVHVLKGDGDPDVKMVRNFTLCSFCIDLNLLVVFFYSTISTGC